MIEEKEKAINLQNDWLFKAYMTNPNSREMVSNVISEITGIDKEILRNATYIGGEEIAKRNKEQKKQATDMTIRIDEHKHIIVEMNSYLDDYSFNKNSGYAMSRIVETTTSKTEYGAVILINIDSKNKFHTKKPIDIFRIQDEERNLEVDSYLSYHVLLENFNDKTYNIGKETKKFAEFLRKKKTVEELLQEYKGDEEYMSVIRTVDELSHDPEFAGYYDIEEKHRQQIADAKETGMDEGLEKATHSIVKKMLEDKVNLDIISKYTNLSIEEIKKLQKENE